MLLHHLKHNKVLHREAILLSVRERGVPRVAEDERIKVTDLQHGVWRIVAEYGFMETPNVPDVISAAKKIAPLRAAPLETTYYLGRELILPDGKAPLAHWRKRLYAFMARNARSATEFFSLPPNRVVELGAQLEL